MKVPTLKTNRGRWAIISLLVLAVYIVLPQFADFRSSWQVLSNIDLQPALLAVLFTALTYLAAGATYCLLAFKKLSYWRTVEVQLAAMFVNRLLPAGLGALGTNYAYLRHTQHTKNQAVSVVAVNNLLGAAGHGLLTLLVLMIAGQTGLPSGVSADSAAVKLTALAVALLAGAVAASGKWRAKLAGAARQLLSYRQRPERLGAALLSSIGLTACNVLCLWAVATAAGLHLPLAALFIIFTFGISLGTATPTPGGLGGFEAGLFAGLVAYQVPAGPALAVALLYRLISYWLVLAVGAVTFLAANRQGLFTKD